MNNLNFKDMTNKTAFVGRVNGETFNNVADYNARLKELIDAGVIVNASSETKVFGKDESEYTTSTTLDPYDEDLSIYPYMCEDDPFYLDLLVTEDPVTNQEAYNEAQKFLEKCYRYTHDVMKDRCNCERKEYLNIIANIINDITVDIADTVKAIDEINAKKKKAEDAYRQEMNDLNAELNILEAADKVAGMFKAYYEDVQNEMFTMIKNDQNNGCDCNCVTNAADDTPEVTTSVEETTPQLVADFTSLLNKIFGDLGGIYKTKQF